MSKDTTRHFHLRSPSGRAITVAYRQGDHSGSGATYYWAAAFCCRKDTFRKKRGAAIARARLEKDRGRAHGARIMDTENLHYALVNSLMTYAYQNPSQVPSWVYPLCLDAAHDFRAHAEKGEAT